MGEVLKTMMNYKMRRLRVAGVLFALGSVALAVLIVFVIRKPYLLDAFFFARSCCDPLRKRWSRC
jgi:hypothetical protein